MADGPAVARKGRGATFNPGNRFAHDVREAVDDGWGRDPGDRLASAARKALDNDRPSNSGGRNAHQMCDGVDDESCLSDADGDDVLAPLKTVVTLQHARSIVSKNASPDISFTQSINPYQGCEHGCIYCYARPTHAYLDLSPGLDFETKLFAKTNAGALLREELSRPSYQCDMIALGANTDPYQPIEREHRVTRQILEVLAEFQHPVGIVTKSALVERDIDILASMAAHRLVRVFVSITTLDRDLARKMEPRAMAPERRLTAVKRLSAAGIPVGVLTAPMIPQLNDRDLEAILEAAAANGATHAGYVVLRLPHEVKDLFKDWLLKHYPDRAAHVMSVMRQMRDGRENDPNFGSRMRGSGEFASLIEQRFRLACRRLRLNEAREPLDHSRFRVPGRPVQATLF